MYLFKTSGNTFSSVIDNEKHAYDSMPSNWEVDEIVLVSENKEDCSSSEKQIHFIMQIKCVRSASSDEIDKYWPGNGHRWQYIIECHNTHRLNKEFDLEDVLEKDAKEYKTVQSHKKIRSDHEKRILNHLNRYGSRKLNKGKANVNN
jgi:hypothetical protein